MLDARGLGGNTDRLLCNCTTPKVPQKHDIFTCYGLYILFNYLMRTESGIVGVNTYYSVMGAGLPPSPPIEVIGLRKITNADSA